MESSFIAVDFLQSSQIILLTKNIDFFRKSVISASVNAKPIDERRISAEPSVETCGMIR